MGSIHRHHHHHVHVRRASLAEGYDAAIMLPSNTYEVPLPSMILERTPASGDNYGQAPGQGSSSGGSSGGGSTTSDSAPAPSMSCGADGRSKCAYDTGVQSTTTIPIVLGVVIPVSIFVVAMLVIWRIKKKRDRAEKMNDKHASLDFGLGEVNRSVKGSRARKGLPPHGAPEMMDLSAEKEFRRAKGMSMDMRSPYVLPEQLTSSRPSLHSLSRSNHDGEDPYRPVTLLRAESPSLGPSRFSPSRAESRKDSASVWTQSSEGTSGMKGGLVQNAQKPSSSSPPTSSSGETPLLGSSFSLGISPSADPQATGPYTSQHPFRKPVPGGDTVTAAGPISPLDLPTPTIVPPPPQASASAAETGFDFNLPAVIEMPSPTIHITSDDGVGASSKRMSLQAANSQPPQPPKHESVAESEDYETYADVLGIVQKETNDPYLGGEGHGLGVQGLGIDTHRLSASLRPLPPDDPEENPEDRANRIRSFYREYFDDRRDTSLGLLGGGGYGGAEYYEDYSQEHLNGATLVDAQSGQFVVGNHAPFAQPLTRRAMTPPPRAPPQFRSGSSAGHRQYGPGQGKRPRGQSTTSAQGARGRAASRPRVPPAPLNNLPTPHLLRDDSAIFNAMDFAPPSTYKDRQAGRPESPFREQRPYSPTVRPFTPLASSFNELRPMPSPHLLRKSGTFTALDFAPPPRFHGEGMSDAGSIRSGRSNTSSHVANIRAGAYRVSRMPAAVVGTKDDFAASLRPTWEQRGPTS